MCNILVYTLPWLPVVLRMKSEFLTCAVGPLLTSTAGYIPASQAYIYFPKHTKVFLVWERHFSDFLTTDLREEIHCVPQRNAHIILISLISSMTWEVVTVILLLQMKFWLIQDHWAVQWPKQHSTLDLPPGPALFLLHYSTYSSDTHSRWHASPNHKTAEASLQIYAALLP